MAANKYGTAATAIYPGDNVTIWNVEAAVTGDRSQALSLGRPFEANQGPAVVSVEILFSGAPGVFAIDAQDANTDTDLAYQNVAAVHIAAVDGNNYARVDFNLRAPFLRFKVTSLANAVNLTLKVAQ